MRFTVDSNVLVYAVDPRDLVKHRLAVQIVTAATRRDCILTTQSLFEFYSVAVRKIEISPFDATGLVRRWVRLFPGADTNRVVLDRAMLMSQEGRFSHWDAMLLATAEEAGCELCLSEDMQDGAMFGRLAVCNPFNGDQLSARAKEVLRL